MATYEYSYMIEEALGTGLVSALISGVPSMLLGIAAYVLTAMALYTLAKRRGLNHPWLAWIPVANSWIVGSLSDQYRYIVKGENRSKRKILLTLNIVNSCLALVTAVVAIAMVVNLVTAIVGGADEMAILSSVMGPAMGVAGLFLPIFGVAIACAIVYYMAMYDIYKSMDPGNCVLFLVLSIIFNVTEPFFLFFNRNKDQGMPPRRQEAQYIPPQEPQWQQPQQEAWQPQSPVQEPWENPENKDYL